MHLPVRSYLSAGVTAVGASAIAVASSIAPPPDVRIPPEPPAAIKVVSDTTVELLATVRNLAPRLVSSPPRRIPASTTAPGAPAAVVLQGPVAQNAASDFVVNAWNAALPWIDYGVDLTDYVLGFIPGLSIIGDQVSIVYYSLVRPVADSFVVNLVAPVVNAPLNPASYVNGLATLGSVTVTSLINLGINEFNYFFGWLVPPIPPIQLAAPVTATPAAQALTAAVDTSTTASPADQAASTITDAADVPASVRTAMNTGAPPAPDGSAEMQDDSSVQPSTDDTDALETPTDDVTKGEEKQTPPSSSTQVAAQGAVSADTHETTADTAKPADQDKEGATDSSSHSSATNGDEGAKQDNKGEKGEKDNKSEKKHSTGKKDRIGKGDRHASART